MGMHISVSSSGNQTLGVISQSIFAARSAAQMARLMPVGSCAIACTFHRRWSWCKSGTDSESLDGRRIDAFFVMHFFKKLVKSMLLRKKILLLKPAFRADPIKTCIGFCVLNIPQTYPFLTTRLPLGGKNPYFAWPFRQICRRMLNF